MLKGTLEGAGTNWGGLGETGDTEGHSGGDWDKLEGVGTPRGMLEGTGTNWGRLEKTEEQTGRDWEC